MKLTLTHSIVLSALLLSGCITEPIATRAEIQQSQTITFEHITEPQLMAAIQQLFILADPTDIVMEEGAHVVEITRSIQSGYFTLLENWRFDMQADMDAMRLQVAAQLNWMLGDTVTPRNAYYYELVARRLRYLLGEPGAEWETCEAFYQRTGLDRTFREHSFLCIFADDNAPTISQPIGLAVGSSH